MKLRSTTPVSATLVTKSILVAAAAVMAISAPIQMGPIAYADNYDEQIRAIKKEIKGYQGEAARLSDRADSLQNALKKLSAEKATIQSQIDLSQAELDKLSAEIKETEHRIAVNSDALGKIMADMYVDESISPLEMLASSNNIGDYVDQVTYQTSVQDQLGKTIDTVKTLKKDLETKKVDVERVIADQESQRDTLRKKESEQAKLLADTKGEEAAYKRIANERQGEVNRLVEAQKAEMARRLAAAQANYGGTTVGPGDPNRGGYPLNLASAPQNSIAPDPWGMFNRQCTSYAAHKVDERYGNMPYWGNVPANATNWPDRAREAGFTTGPSPKKHSVAVMHDGSYGHVAWVESVNSDGSVNITQYNWNWSAEHSTMTLPASFFQEYIYFGG